MKLTGRVVGETDTFITVSAPTRVRRILASPGQSVDEGHPLIETGESDRHTQVDQAQHRARLADARVTRAQVRLEVRLRDVLADIRRFELGAGDAMASNLIIAQSAVLQAKADARRAEAELTRLTAPPRDLDVRTADHEIRAAEVALRKAEADRDRVLKGPDQTEIRKAEGDVAAAEARAQQATETLRKLTSGAESRDVQAAEKAVKVSQENLRAAREPPPEIAASRVLILSSRDRGSREREAVRKLARQNVEAARARQQADVERAEADLERALNALADAKQGAGQKEAELASRIFRSALSELGDARERLVVLQDGPTQLQIDAANSAHEGARVALERARARRTALDEGTPADLLEATQAAVAGAQAAVRAAETNVAELTATQARQIQELDEAVSQAELLQSVLDGKVDLDGLNATVIADPDIVELAQAHAELASAQDSLSSLTNDPGSTTLVAPAGGIVTALQTAPGELLIPRRPAVTLVQTSDLAIQVPLNDGDQILIAAGQAARVSLNTAPETEVAATVSRIDEVDGGRFASLTPSWSSPLPAIGTAVRVAVSLERKEGALLVPLEAIQSIDGRHFATVVRGTAVQRVEVSLGLRNESDVEVVAGLAEGQIVLAGLTSSRVP